MHQIDIDRARRMIIVSLVDWVELAEARQIVMAKEQVVLDLGLPFKGHSCLIDVRELRILPQETIMLVVGLFVQQQYKARRIAFVAGVGGIRIQIKRLICGAAVPDRYRLFDTPDQAELWLCGEDRRAA